MASPAQGWGRLYPHFETLLRRSERTPFLILVFDQRKRATLLRVALPNLVDFQRAGLGWEDRPGTADPNNLNVCVVNLSDSCAS